MIENLEKYEIRYKKEGRWYGATLEDAIAYGLVDEVKSWIANHFFKSMHLYNGNFNRSNVIKVMEKIEQDGYRIPVSTITDDEEFVIKK